MILDDMAGTKALNRHSDQLLSRMVYSARHSRLSLIIIVQKYNAVSTRVRLNASHLMVFRLPTMSERKLLLNDLSDVEAIEEKYEKATKDKYAFLYISRDGGKPRAFKCFEDELGGDQEVNFGAEGEEEEEEDRYDEDADSDGWGLEPGNSDT